MTTTFKECDVMDVIFLRVKSVDIAYIKFVFEAYEEVGLVRTIDKASTIISLLVVPDFSWVARGILASMHPSIQVEEIDRPPDLEADWLLKYIPGFAGEV